MAYAGNPIRLTGVAGGTPVAKANLAAMMAVLLVLTCLNVAFNFAFLDAARTGPAGRDPNSPSQNAPSAAAMPTASRMVDLLAVQKDFGGVQVSGHPLQIFYCVHNASETEGLFDITVRDESFGRRDGAGVRFCVPPAGTSQCPGCRVNEADGGGVSVDIRIPHLLPGQRIVRTVTLVPRTSDDKDGSDDSDDDFDTFIDRPAISTYSDSSGCARTPVVSRSANSSGVSILRILPAPPPKPKYKHYRSQREDPPWWHGIPILQEWRQRLFIGLWAALASALPMYWYEWLLEDLTRSKGRRISLDEQQQAQQRKDKKRKAS